MARGTVGEEAWKSVRLVWHRERWLSVGVPVAAVGYGFWLGVTGAAVTYLAEGLAGPLTVTPWTSLTDVVVATLALLWIVLPAAVVAILVRDRLTNVRGNLATPYRLRHPSLLLAPPALLLAAGLLALARIPSAAAIAQALLVAGSIWFVVRTGAYAYRVFALSLPIVGHAIAFLAAGLGAVAVLTLGSRVVGREALIEAVATGAAARTGLEGVAAVPSGTVEVLGTTVPVVVWAVVAVPVGAAAGYVAVQTLASLVVRARKPTVRRPELRTGQRYPAFARPTTAAGARPAGAETRRSSPSASESASAAGAVAESAATSGSDESAGSTDGDEVAGPEVHVSHTKVYTPPDDAEVVDPVTVAGWTAKRPTCRACGESYDPADADGTCPECGAKLAP